MCGRVVFNQHKLVYIHLVPLLWMWSNPTNRKVDVNKDKKIYTGILDIMLPNHPYIDMVIDNANVATKEEEDVKEVGNLFNL